MLVNLGPPSFTGACEGMDTDLFFTDHPEDHPDLTVHQVRWRNERKTAAAKAVCASCPVRLKCLEWQLKYEIKNRETMPGVFGGLSQMERQRIRMQRAA